MLPMLTIVGYINQNNIIYKCTKLHNPSSNRKICMPIFGRSGGGTSPLAFKKKFVLMGTFT